MAYVIMEQIYGRSLDVIWPSLSTSNKESLGRQLRIVLRDMRQLPTPGGHCSVGHGGLADRAFWLGDGHHPYTFATELDLDHCLHDKAIEATKSITLQSALQM